jgi:cell division protein FtsB
MMNFNSLNPLRWNKKVLLVLLGGFIFIWVAFLSTYSLLARYKLHRRYKHLQKQTRQLQADTKTLKQKIDKLKTDPALTKRLAREKYGMKKPGETVYKIKVIH